MNAMDHVEPRALPEPYTFEALLFGGKWQAGSAGTTWKDVDPYNGEVLLELSQAGPADIDVAFATAARAQAEWRSTLPGERAEVLRRAVAILDARHAEIVNWLIRESGSVRIKAELEWSAVRAIFLEASTLPSRTWGRIIAGDIPGKEHRVYRRPLGVVSVISPWNWPFHLSTRALAPAIALGNAVVLKPASETIVTGGLLIAKIFEEAGLPAGVLSVVGGDNQVIGDPYVLHPLSRVISFTGSTPVGRRIAQLAVQGKTLKKVQLELGGNNPLVVLDDADLDHAVAVAVFGRFLHQGELCVSTNRIIVDARVHDRFVEAFVERVRSLKYGDPAAPDTAIGPIISQKQLLALQRMIAEARADGATERVGGPAEGLLLPPHVFTNVSEKVRLGRDEIFGPIAPVLQARGEADALRMANDTEYGLSSAVLTGDVARGERFAHRVEAGMTHVNDVPAVDLANMPFGGEKNSGLGRFGALGVIEDFTTEHWISVPTNSTRVSVLNARLVQNCILASALTASACAPDVRSRDTRSVVNDPMPVSVMAAANTQKTRTAEEARNLALVEASFEKWKAGTGGPFELLAPDATWTIVGESVVSRTYTSKKDFMDAVIVPFNARMSRPLQPRMRGLYADGSMVVALFDASATARDEKPYQNTYSWFMRMNQGHIVDVIAFFDSVEFNDFWARVAPAL